MARTFPVVPRTYGELNASAYPTMARQPEATPYWYFDTQPYPAAGTVAPIVFFSGVQADPTLGNWPVAGQLPDPQTFQVFQVTLDIFPQAAPFVNAAAADNLGTMNNLGLLTLVGRPVITLRLSQKDYGQFPMSLLHATGGPNGQIQSTTAAAGSMQWAVNGPFDGGMKLGGAFEIPPLTDFRVTIQYGLAVTPTVAYFLRLTLGGALYRAVK